MSQTIGTYGLGRNIDEFRLDRRVALVTGAGRGIGAGIAFAFARAGADVALVARTPIELENVAALVRSVGRMATVIPADVADISQASTVIERTIAAHGRLDVLVNNAGGAPPTPYLETTSQDLDKAFHFNVSSALELVKCATSDLLDSGHGSIINVSSRMDRLVSRNMLIYGIVKAAVTHMTRLLAAELAPRIRVNGISPGVVETDGLKAVLDDEVRRRIVSATPLHRLATVEDVANVACWLASPSASYITGKIIEVDGGAEAPVFPYETPDL